MQIGAQNSKIIWFCLLFDISSQACSVEDTAQGVLSRDVAAEESFRQYLRPQDLNSCPSPVGLCFAQRSILLARTQYFNLTSALERVSLGKLSRIAQFVEVRTSTQEPRKLDVVTSTTSSPAFHAVNRTSLTPALQNATNAPTGAPADLENMKGMKINDTQTPASKGASFAPTRAPGSAPIAVLPTGAPVDLEKMMGMKIDSPHDLVVILHTFAIAVIVVTVCLIGFDMMRGHLPEVYAARCVGQHSKRGLQTPFLPPVSWGTALAMGWRMQDQEILASCGLDGLIFLKFWEACLKALGVSAAIICPVLFISHVRGDRYHFGLLLRLCVLNVPSGSALMWLDALAVWVVALSFFYFLSKTHQDLAARRLVYLRDRPCANQIFVYSIPVGSAPVLPFGSDGSGASRASKFLDRFFRRCHPELVEATEPIGQADDHEPPPCGIVTFRTARDAHVCAQTQHGSTQHRWQVRLAPDSQEEFLRQNMIPKNAWSLSKNLAGLVGLAAVFCFWFVPVSAICAMARLEMLYEVLPVTVDWFHRHPHVSHLVQGILSTAGLNLFMALLPYILDFLSRLRGHLLERDVDRSVQNMLFYFQLVFVLLVAALGQSALIILVEFARSPGHIVGAVGLVLPKVSNFYVSYLILQLAVLAFRLLFVFSLYEWWANNKSENLTEKLRVPLETWGVKYARWTIILVIALVYSSIAPIVLPLAFCVFALGYAVHSYEIVFVSEAPFEVGGLNLPVATHHVQIGLAVHQFLMIALLAMRGSRSWVLVAPLPLLNYAFFDYCRATFKVRFLPLEDIQPCQSNEAH